MTIIEHKRAPALGIVALLALTVACSVAGFAALVLSGAIGGTAMGVAPRQTFGLVAPLICPEGSQLSYSEERRSYHNPGESEPHLECVAPDGTRRDVLFPAIGAVLGLTFAGVFGLVLVATLVPTVVLIAVLPRTLTTAPSRRGDLGP